MFGANFRKSWQFLFKLFVTLSLVGVIFFHVNTNEFLHYLSSLPLHISLIVTLLFSLQLFFAAVRWFFILNSYREIPISKVLEISAFSILLQNFLIGSLGGVLAKIALTKRLHVPLTISTLTVIMDRIIILFVLTIMILMSMPFLPCNFLSELKTIGALGLGLIISGLACWLFFKRHWQLNKKKYKKYIQTVKKFFPTLGWSIFLSVTSLFFYFGGVYLIAAHLELSLSIWNIFLVMPIVALVSSLPISLSGWGVRESIMIIALSGFGVEKEAALALSVFIGFLSVMSVFPLLIFSLITRNKKLISSLKKKNEL